MSQQFPFLKRPSLIFSLAITFPHLILLCIWCWILGIYELIFHYRDLRGRSAGPRALHIKKLWALQHLKIHEIEVERRGTFKGSLQDLRGVIFVSNHQSIEDVVVAMATLPDDTSFVAKRELQFFPIFGQTAILVGTLFIDRTRGTRNTSLERIGDHLKKGGNIMIYPEGTRSPDGKLIPFKRGAFIIAIQSQAPIIPITIKGSRELCPKKSLSIAPGKVQMFVDEPIVTIGMVEKDRYHLSDQVRDILAKNLEN